VAAKHSRPRSSPVAALGAVFDRVGGSFITRARLGNAGAGPVPRRVAALLAPPPGRRWILQAVVVVVAVLAGLCTLDAAHDLHELVESASYPRG
jgi:hypothetical protein